MRQILKNRRMKKSRRKRIREGTKIRRPGRDFWKFSEETITPRAFDYFRSLFPVLPSSLVNLAIYIIYFVRVLIIVRFRLFSRKIACRPLPAHASPPPVNRLPINLPPRPRRQWPPWHVFLATSGRALRCVCAHVHVLPVGECTPDLAFE